MTSTIETRRPIDKNIGIRLRALRKERGVTQDAMADFLGISFQQIQKYEAGTNRLSASVLWEISVFLGVPVGSFFLDLDETADVAVKPSSEDEALGRFHHSAEGRKLGRALLRLGPSITTRITNLATGLVDEGHEEPGERDFQLGKERAGLQ